MNWRARIAVGALAVLVVGLLAVLLIRLREPRYQGRRISSWLEEIDMWQTPGVTSEPAEAVRTVGTAALPWVLRMLETKDSAFKRKLEEWGDKQKLFGSPFDDPKSVRSRGVAAMRVLGPRASGAMPKLTAMLNDPELAGTAAQSLASIGPAALPVLVQNLTNQTADVRFVALSALEGMGTNAEQALPAIIAATQDPDYVVCQMALGTVGVVGRNQPDRVMAVLIDRAQNGDARTRGIAMHTLAVFGTNQPAKVLPVIQAGLDDIDLHTRFAAIWVLGMYKTEAKPAVPKLLSLLHDQRAGPATALTLTNILGADALPLILKALPDQNKDGQVDMIRDVADFGPAAQSAVPDLLPFADSPEFKVRTAAFRALGRIHSQADLVVPALIAKLIAADTQTQLAAAEALGAYGAEAKAAIPALTEKIQQTSAPGIKAEFKAALGKIDLEAVK